MSVAPLPTWDVTPIEIAVDLERPRPQASLVFSGPAEPRICLVAAFALTAQLKRIVAAVDRAIPARLPAGLRIAPAKRRVAGASHGVALSPMLALLRLQRKLIRAIAPGLANSEHTRALFASIDMDDATAQFVNDFVPGKTLPTFEPLPAMATFTEMLLSARGITIYRLGPSGEPQLTLGHWAYAADPRGSVHLRRGP